MNEVDYEKLIIEQYKIMINSTEKVTEARHRANAFFLTIITSIISLSFLIGKEMTFDTFAFIFMLFLSVIGIALCVYWYKTIQSYKQLNTGKFQLIFELEEKLKSSLFNREWKILKDGVGYTETSQIEKNIVIAFGILLGIKILIEFALILIYITMYMLPPLLKT